MKWLCEVVICGLALGGIVLVQVGTTSAVAVGPAEKAAQVISVRNVKVQDGVVSGELANTSKRPLRDVQLLIRYSWRWENEFKPGSDEFGTAVYYTVEKEIPPGGRASFTYKPASPLPSRPDGYFETAVSVAGFTEIIR